MCTNYHVAVAYLSMIPRPMILTWHIYTSNSVHIQLFLERDNGIPGGIKQDTASLDFEHDVRYTKVAF